MTGVSSSSLEHHHHPDNDDASSQHAGSTEAWIVRGVSRSVERAVAGGRSLANLPQVGRLPRAAPRKVPVRRVARYADRVSTGLDVWDALDTEDATTTSKRRRRQQLARIGSFATSLVKNTVLGAIVFETYCWMVAKADEILPPTDPTTLTTTTTTSYKDVFETTPVAVHFLAGAAGGSLQGVGGMIWESTAETISKKKLSLPSLSPALRTTGQHAAAHSILFGSYESCKRLVLCNLQYLDPEWKDDTTPTYFTAPPKSLLPHQRVEYFLGITLAGGLAGQVQHVASHLLEQPSWKTLRMPPLSSSLCAFPPSAIAFLAFEYGKDQVAKLSGEEEDDDD